MPALHVKKGDTVRILSGNDKGKTGVVKEAFPRQGKVLVEGVNLRWRHRKPSQQQPKGERVQREAPLFACKVMRVEAKPAKKAAKKHKKAAKPAAEKAAEPAAK